MALFTLSDRIDHECCGGFDNSSCSETKSTFVFLKFVFQTTLHHKSFLFISFTDSFRQLTCGDNCMMSITPHPIVTVAKWLFDNNLLDENSIYAGTTNPLGTAVTYTVGNIDVALVLDGAHYISIDTHFLNISYQSFTIEG